MRLTRDGIRSLAGPDGRRFVALAGAGLWFVPLVAGVAIGGLGASSPTYTAIAGVVAAGALAQTGRLSTRARRIAAAQEQTVRIERAARIASQALLKRAVADPVGSALGALIDGVAADAVFLETNGDEDLDEHGNIPSVRDILHAPSNADDPGRWELTGWRVGPIARAALSAGRAFRTDTADLDRLTVACYQASRIGSEILLPITTENAWVGSVGFTSSDSDREWTEEEVRLLRATAEMIGAYWERRDAKGRLEELLAAKDEFIASVSHEVRTPLTAVLGFAHELDEHMDKFSVDERAELIRLIASQSQEVADIVDDLLTAARADAGTLIIAAEEVSVRSLVGAVLSSHSCRVDFSMSEDLDIWADAGRVRQILRNLLTNAARYGGSTVKINTHRAANMIRIEVRDNGAGIPHGMRAQIFEPYARANDKASDPASAGLGLSVARRLAEMMDGRLELTVADGWTVFTLTLPAASVIDQPLARATND